MVVPTHLCARSSAKTREFRAWDRYVTSVHQTMTISFVVLNWNTAALTQKLLDSLAEQTCRLFDVILVDNGSSELFTPVLPSWLRAKILRLERNHGFAGGMN